MQIVSFPQEDFMWLFSHNKHNIGWYHVGALLNTIESRGGEVRKEERSIHKISKTSSIEKVCMVRILKYQSQAGVFALRPRPHKIISSNVTTGWS